MRFRGPLLALSVSIAVAGCVVPPADVRPVAAAGVASAQTEGIAKSVKAERVVRSRALGRVLAFAELQPAASIAPLNRELYAPSPPPALRSAGLRQLASLHLTEGRPEAAVGAARAARDLAVETYGPHHVESLGALIDLSDALSAAGRPVEAKAALAFAAEDAARAFPSDHPFREATALRLGVRRWMAPVTPLLRSLSGQANHRG